MVSIFVPFFFLFVVCYINVQKHFCCCFHTKKLTLFSNTICVFSSLRRSDSKKQIYFSLPPSVSPSCLSYFLPFPLLLFFLLSLLLPSLFVLFLLILLLLLLFFIITQETPVRCTWVFQTFILYFSKKTFKIFHSAYKIGKTISLYHMIELYLKSDIVIFQQHISQGNNYHNHLYNFNFRS